MMGRSWTWMLLALLLCTFYSGSCDVQIIDPSTNELQVYEGDTMELTCENRDGGAISWAKDGMTMEPDDRITINEVVIGASLNSILRAEELTAADSGRYECKNPDDYFDKVEINVDVAAASGENVRIVDPSGDTADVQTGEDLTLKCTGGQDSELIWKHNGMPLAASTKVIITVAQDIQTQMTTSILTRSSVSDAESGSYTCEDSEDFFNKDEVTVSVVDYQPGRAGVAISDPSGSSLNVAIGESFSLRCEGDAATSGLTWAKDGTLVTSLGEEFIMNMGEDVHSGTKFSMLTKEGVTEEDSGDYSCSDSEDSSNTDTVHITVGESSATSVSQASFWMLGCLLVVLNL